MKVFPYFKNIWGDWGWERGRELPEDTQSVCDTAQSLGPRIPRVDVLFISLFCLFFVVFGGVFFFFFAASCLSFFQLKLSWSYPVCMLEVKGPPGISGTTSFLNLVFVVACSPPEALVWEKLNKVIMSILGIFCSSYVPRNYWLSSVPRPLKTI